MKKLGFFICLFLSLGTITLIAQDQPDEKINDLIRKHGLDESHVMETASWMTDVYAG